jgi:ankyrin repeat protein
MDRPKRKTFSAAQALGSAARDGRTAQVERLLAAGVDFEEKLRNGSCAIHCAVKGRHLAIVEILLDWGGDVRVKTDAGDTPLHCAVMRLPPARDYPPRVRDKLVQLLLRRGAKADINVKNFDGETPLHRAAMWRGAVTVQILLENGAHFHVRNRWGNTPEECATLSGNRLVAALLRDVPTREAFTMGQHARLGATSLVLALDEGVVRMILDQACGCAL